MKKTYRPAWLAGLFAACILIFVAGAGFCAEVKASLTNLEGTVKARESDTAEWKAAAEGMKLGAGAAVRCEAGASAFLNWKGNTVKVHPLSDLRVSSLKVDSATGLQQSELELMKGKTFARAKKLTTKDSTFSIKTPSAVAGVRGTDFGVTLSEDQTTSVAVMSDEVVVEAGGVEMTVTESMITMVEMGAPPMEPTAIPDDMMQELQADVQEVGEVEAAVSEAPAAEEEAEEKAEEEEAASEEEAAAEEAPAEGEAVAEEGAAMEEAGGAEMEDMSGVVEDTTSATLQDNLNQNVAEQSETLFQECCQPR